MTTTTATKTLVQKLAEVALAVDRIPKRGHNDFHNYDYATEADIAEAVRKELATRHVVMFPNVVGMDWREGREGKDGRTTPICVLNVEWTIKDGESADEIKYHVPGAGQDSGDKGPYKALTGSQKYALLKLLQIPTGDDPERDSSSQSAQQRNGRRRSDFAAKGKGYKGTEPPFEYQPPAEDADPADKPFLVSAIVKSANDYKLTSEERKALAQSYTAGKALQDTTDVAALKKLYLFLGDADAVKQWREERKGVA